MKKFLAAILIVALFASAIFWFLKPRSRSSCTTAEVDRPFSLSAYAGPLFLRGGEAFAIVSGELNGTAKIEIVGNQGRDWREIRVGPGKVGVATGGAENWISDYHIRYTPITATHGHLYAAVYCGKGMDAHDRKLHHELSLRQRR